MVTKLPLWIALSTLCLTQTVLGNIVYKTSFITATSNPREINCVIVGDSQYSSDVRDIMAFKTFLQAIGDELYTNNSLIFKSSITFFGPFGTDNGKDQQYFTRMIDKYTFDKNVNALALALNPMTQENLLSYLSNTTSFPYLPSTSCLLYVSATSTNSSIASLTPYYKTIVGVAFNGFSRSPVTNTPLVINDFSQQSVQSVVNAVIAGMSVPDTTTTSQKPASTPTPGPRVPITAIIIGDTTVDNATQQLERQFIRHVADQLYENNRVNFWASITYFGVNSNYGGQPQQFTSLSNQDSFDFSVYYVNHPDKPYPQDNMIAVLNNFTSWNIPYPEYHLLLWFSGTASQSVVATTDLYQSAVGVTFGNVTSSPVTSQPLVVDLSNPDDENRVVQYILQQFIH